MNIFDKIGNYINEAVISASNASIYKQLGSWTAVDKPIGNGVQGGPLGRPKKSLEQQASYNLFKRNADFDRIDWLEKSHLANTIKDIIISDGFCELGNKNSITVKYSDDSNPKKTEMFNEDIAKMLKKTKFLDILEECVANEGMSYSEIFLTTKFELGKGLVKVDDDLDIRNHVALYRNTDFVGALEFQIDGKNAKGKKFINPEFISHFMLNYKKIPVKLAKNFVEQYKLPEKIRVAKPLLVDVVELILQYDILEKLATAIELNQATQPIFMGIGVSPDQDIGEISRNLQEWSNVLNKNKNNVINSLESLDVGLLMSYMQQIELVPFSQDEGTNMMRQIQVNYKDTNLTDKINNLRKIIAQAVGVPESYLATMTYQGAKDTKEDALHTNPRYSRMLFKIQQLIAKGIRDVIYKHLKFKYSNEQGVCTRNIDKDCIEVLFDSATNLNSRLENENMILNAQAMSDLLGMIDGVATSQNIHVKVKTENFMDLWKKEFSKVPAVRDIFEEMTEEEIEQQQAMMYGNVDDYEDMDDNPPPGIDVPVPDSEENPLKRNRGDEGELEEIGNGSQTSRISNILR